MLIQEQINNLLHTHSDEGFYILQNETQQQYEEAWDVLPCKYTYTETDIEIPVEEVNSEKTATTNSLAIGL